MGTPSARVGEVKGLPNRGSCCWSLAFLVFKGDTTALGCWLYPTLIVPIDGTRGRFAPVGVGVTGGSRGLGMLLGTGGVGIFQGFESARYSLSLVEKIDMVLFAVRRKKSARGLVSSVGMGSEIVGRLWCF